MVLMDPLAFLLSNPDYATEPHSTVVTVQGGSVGSFTIRRIVEPPFAELQTPETLIS